MKLYIPILFLLFSCQAKAEKINWGKLSPETIARAKNENKIILLNLKANWCHWCHVMKDSTYSNEKVITYINQYFIPVEADQDANPELAIRYKEYGWPATVFINGAGEDVVKRAGYIAPNLFLNLLKAIVKDPSPEIAEKSLAKTKIFEGEDKETLLALNKSFLNSLDIEVGGFDQAQKYVEYDTYEYALYEDETEETKQWIKNSVKGAKNLSDDAWGGIYQYSTHYDWEHLHFEKLLTIQARYLHIFNTYKQYYNNEESDKYIQGILAYLNRFLKRENGLYANAQDADLVQREHAEEYFKLNDKERTKKGIPHIDTNTYTQNNAEMAIALLKLSYTETYKSYKNDALIILQELKKRKANNGLFYHGNDQRQIWSLKDQIGVIDLYIELLKDNPENKGYEKELGQLITAVTNAYLLENGSAKSFVGENGLSPNPIITENIKLARALNWYSHYSKKQEYKVKAKALYTFLINPEVVETYYNEPAILMLNNELNNEPNQFVFLEITNDNKVINKAKAMASFYSLFNTYTYKTLPEEKQGMFGGFDKNVLFVCTSNYCSSPMYTNQDIVDFLVK